MAIFGLSITKTVLFRGVQQPFSNVYHYQGTLPDAAQALAIAQFVTAIEKPLHASDVTWTGYKLWSAGGSPTANQMINQGVLSGNGTQTTIGSLDRERAILIRFKNGTDVRGRPVFLRKWFHTCGNCAGVTLSTAGIMQNTAVIPSADRTTIQNAADDLLTIVVNAVTYNLCSKRGINATAPVECHNYLEHHQLGDAWRG